MFDVITRPERAEIRVRAFTVRRTNSNFDASTRQRHYYVVISDGHCRIVAIEQLEYSIARTDYSIVLSNSFPDYPIVKIQKLLFSRVKRIRIGFEWFI